MFIYSFSCKAPDIKNFQGEHDFSLLAVIPIKTAFKVPKFWGKCEEHIYTGFGDFTYPTQAKSCLLYIYNNQIHDTDYRETEILVNCLAPVEFSANFQGGEKTRRPGNPPSLPTTWWALFLERLTIANYWISNSFRDAEIINKNILICATEPGTEVYAALLYTNAAKTSVENLSDDDYKHVSLSFFFITLTFSITRMRVFFILSVFLINTHARFPL